MLLEIFQKQCELYLYTLNYRLLDDMAKDIRGLGTIFVLDSSTYEYFNVHTKRAFKTASRRRLPRRMELIIMMERICEMARFQKNNIYRRLGW